MRTKGLFSMIREGKAKVMGILNVTPDSFYDGGMYIDQASAFGRVRTMVEEGADLVDVGAESTRPGSAGVGEEEEIRRLFSPLEILQRFDIPVSLDTSKPGVARKFLELGWVDMINDVTGLKDPEMMRVVKEFEVPCVMMHMFGSPRDMQKTFKYKDVVADIKEFFSKRLNEVSYDKVIIDPGIGFGKSVEHNLEILRRLDEFKGLGCPIMLGISRKSFIGNIVGGEPADRLEGSLGAASIAVLKGADILRVHDVKETIRAIRVVEAIRDVSYKEIQV